MVGEGWYSTIAKSCVASRVRRSPVETARRTSREEVILATLPQYWLALARMKSPRHVSDTVRQAESIGTTARVANVPVKPFPNGTLLTSDAPLAQTPISSQMVIYPCKALRESPDECRTSWGEHCRDQAQKSRARSIGNAAKSANKLLTRDSEPIKTKRNVLDVSY